MKLDMFNHIFPKVYFDKMLEVAPNYKDMGKRVREIPVLYDLEKRFRVMDEFDDYASKLVLHAVEQLPGLLLILWKLPVIAFPLPEYG